MLDIFIKVKHPLSYVYNVCVNLPNAYIQEKGNITIIYCK